MGSPKIINFIEKLETVLKNIAAFCLISMALLTGADILSRGILGKPIFGVEELVTILAVLTTGLALGYTHSQKSNIGVEFLYSKLSRPTRRIIKLITGSVSIILFSTVTWRLYLYGISMRDSGEVSMTLELPTYLVIFALSFGFGCFTLAIVKEMILTAAGEE